jgi:hypothetical protein
MDVSCYECYATSPAVFLFYVPDQKLVLIVVDNIL